jgi:hypothetical protein
MTGKSAKVRASLQSRCLTRLDTLRLEDPKTCTCPGSIFTR